MATGVGHLYYPEQNDALYPLELKGSSFQAKLHEVPAFFQAGWLAKPGCLLSSSEVESFFEQREKLYSSVRYCEEALEVSRSLLQSHRVL